MSLFTLDKVREIAAATEALTGGAFKFGSYNDPGDGGRYIDGVEMKTWRGPFAAERAAAYYVHGAYDWASREQATGEPTLPPVIVAALAVLESITGSEDDAAATDEDRERAYAVTVAADEGARDGEYRWKANQR